MNVYVLHWDSYKKWWKERVLVCLRLCVYGSFFRGSFLASFASFSGVGLSKPVVSDNISSILANGAEQKGKEKTLFSLSLCTVWSLAQSALLSVCLWYCTTILYYHMVLCRYTYCRSARSIYLQTDSSIPVCQKGGLLSLSRKMERWARSPFSKISRTLNVSI